MKSKLTLIILILIVLSLTKKVEASFTVAPMRFEFQIEEDQSSTGSMIIRNNSEDTLAVKIYIKDYLRRSDGSESELEPGTISRSCSQWLSISPMNIELEPGETKEARISMSVPLDAEGTYWSMVYVEQFSKPTPRGGEINGYSFNINVYPRWGIRILESVSGTEKIEGQIANLLINNEDESKQMVAEIGFENTGNVILKCEGYLDIRDVTGETIEKIEFENFSTYPENTRIIKTEIPQTLKPGEYSALAVIDYGGDYLVAGEAFFEISSDTSSEE